MGFSSKDFSLNLKVANFGVAPPGKESVWSPPGRAAALAHTGAAVEGATEPLLSEPAAPITTAHPPRHWYSRHRPHGATIREIRVYRGDGGGGRGPAEGVASTKRVQHGTVRHSTAQHSTTRHRAADGTDISGAGGGGLTQHKYSTVSLIAELATTHRNRQLPSAAATKNI